MYQNQVDQIHSLGDTMVDPGMDVHFHSDIVPRPGRILDHQRRSAERRLCIRTAAISATRCSGPAACFVAAFILFHLWQMHHLGKPLGGGKFDPEHAASSAAIVLDPMLMKIIYTVGMLCAVYHLANGLWTFGITWGIWTSERAQRRAGYICAAFGILVAMFGMGSLYGMSVSTSAKRQLSKTICGSFVKPSAAKGNWSSKLPGGEHLGSRRPNRSGLRGSYQNRSK